MGDLGHERVVVDPDDADRDEADRVRGVAGPDDEQLLRNTPLAQRHVEDEQGRRDREDSVAERFQACGAHRVNSNARFGRSVR